MCVLKTGRLLLITNVGKKGSSWGKTNLLPIKIESASEKPKTNIKIPFLPYFPGLTTTSLQTPLSPSCMAGQVVRSCGNMVCTQQFLSAHPSLSCSSPAPAWALLLCCCPAGGKNWSGMGTLWGAVHAMKICYSVGFSMVCGPVRKALLCSTVGSLQASSLSVCSGMEPFMGCSEYFVWRGLLQRLQDIPALAPCSTSSPSLTLVIPLLFPALFVPSSSLCVVIFFFLWVLFCFYFLSCFAAPQTWLMGSPLASAEPIA